MTPGEKLRAGRRVRPFPRLRSTVPNDSKKSSRSKALGMAPRPRLRRHEICCGENLPGAEPGGTVTPAWAGLFSRHRVALTRGVHLIKFFGAGD
jgi:hypothetical protein